MHKKGVLKRCTKKVYQKGVLAKKCIFKFEFKLQKIFKKKKKKIGRQKNFLKHKNTLFF